MNDGGEKVESNAVMVENPRARAKGNGPGHGGPASGLPASGLPASGMPASGSDAAPFTSDKQPAPWSKAAGWAAAAEIKAEIVARKKDILDAQMARALDPAHPQGHAAAVNLLDRIMPPESKATLAGDGDAPLITRIERVIIGPDDAEKKADK